MYLARCRDTATADGIGLAYRRGGGANCGFLVTQDTLVRAAQDLPAPSWRLQGVPSMWSEAE
eukprot:1177496-Alexandrium_andersonii.AAC.1